MLFRVLQKELQSLAIDVRLLDKEGNQIDMKEVAKENEQEVRKVEESVREVASDYRYVGEADLSSEIE